MSPSVGGAVSSVSGVSPSVGGAVSSVSGVSPSVRGGATERVVSSHTVGGETAVSSIT